MPKEHNFVGRFINMDMKEFEEAQETMSEEEREKGEEPKRVTRPRRSKQQKKGKEKKVLVVELFYLPDSKVFVFSCVYTP
jgi:hypothetical protein